MKEVSRGDVIKVHYTGTFVGGEVFDSSAGKEPLEFTVGVGNMIEGFDDAVIGMQVGEKKDVLLPPEKAYGTVNKELIITVPRSNLPNDFEPVVGQRMQMSNPSGHPIEVGIQNITGDKITLDANPPLAGKELNFSIEVIGILKA